MQCRAPPSPLWFSHGSPLRGTFTATCIHTPLRFWTACLGPHHWTHACTWTRVCVHLVSHTFTCHAPFTFLFTTPGHTSSPFYTFLCHTGPFYIHHFHTFASFLSLPLFLAMHTCCTLPHTRFILVAPHALGFPPRTRHPLVAARTTSLRCPPPFLPNTFPGSWFGLNRFRFPVSHRTTDVLRVSGTSVRTFRWFAWMPGLHTRIYQFDHVYTSPACYTWTTGRYILPCLYGLPWDADIFLRPYLHCHGLHGHALHVLSCTCFCATPVHTLVSLTGLPALLRILVALFLWTVSLTGHYFHFHSYFVVALSLHSWLDTLSSHVSFSSCTTVHFLCLSPFFFFGFISFTFAFSSAMASQFTHACTFRFYLSFQSFGS